MYVLAAQKPAVTHAALSFCRPIPAACRGKSDSETETVCYTASHSPIDGPYGRCTEPTQLQLFVRSEWSKYVMHSCTGAASKAPGDGALEGYLNNSRLELVRWVLQLCVQGPITTDSL